MSDGREEREEQAMLIRRQKQENPEDRIEPNTEDDWEPERVDP